MANEISEASEKSMLAFEEWLDQGSPHGRCVSEVISTPELHAQSEVIE